MPTKTDNRRCLKQFFLWLEDYDPETSNPDKVKFYKYIKKNIATKQKPKMVDYSNIISENDLHQLLSKGCNNSRDKAFITMQHEGGNFSYGFSFFVQIYDSVNSLFRQRFSTPFIAFIGYSFPVSLSNGGSDSSRFAKSSVNLQRFCRKNSGYKQKCAA